MLIIDFPKPKSPHYCTIRDKIRNSGLTSVRFVDDNHLVCCDFNEKCAYLVKYKKGSEFKIIDIHPTIIKGGEAVQTDLIDIFGNTFVTTNFYQGSLSFYTIENGKIRFIKELNLNPFTMVHGVRFIPGEENLVWVSYCGVNNKCFQIVDWKKEKIIRTTYLEEQAQDAAFIGNYVLQFARTNHITKGVVKIKPGVRLKNMYVTVYLYETQGSIGGSEPVLLDVWHGEGHLDATKEFGENVYAANQYTGAIDIFSVQDKKIEFRGGINGFDMPHGLDIREDGLLVATNYGDQTLRMMRIPESGNITSNKGA